MPVRSGRFRHRFELLKPKLDSDGEPSRNEYGELTGELTVVQRPWFNIINVSDSENVSTSIDGQTQMNLEVRYSKMLENPSSDMYIRFRGELYDITSSVDPFLRGEKLHILATKRR